MHLCDVTDYHIFAGSPVCHHQAAQSSQCPSTGKTEPWWQRDRLSVPNPEHGLIHALPPGTHHYLDEKQNNNALNINYHRIYILNLQAPPEVCSADRHISTLSYSLLTSLVNVACCPRLCCVKMGITSDTLTREGMRGPRNLPRRRMGCCLRESLPRSKAWYLQTCPPCHWFDCMGSHGTWVASRLPKPWRPSWWPHVWLVHPL